MLLKRLPIRATLIASLHKRFESSLVQAKPGKIIAIRREDASIWERRAPLAPSHVRQLVRKGVKVFVQPSNRRAYPLQAYEDAGAEIKEDIREASVIIGVKQVPIDLLIPNKTYAFFSHTIKAQEANMPLLDAVLERNIRLIDYEKMVDSMNRRVVAFGRYAGIAGMINIMHGLGLRLLALGHHTPFMHIGPAHNYRDVGMAKQSVRACGYEIALSMMPKSIGPIVFVFTGSGNVSQGAQEIFQELPFEYIPAENLQETILGKTTETKVYATVVSRQDHWVHKQLKPFDPEEAEQYPENYNSIFATKIAPFATVIINGIYWAPNSPRLLTKDDGKDVLKREISSLSDTPPNTPPGLPHRLLAICDISADPGGSIEFMTDCTTIDNPFCLYDFQNNQTTTDFSGPGLLLCSIDNMPTQLPFESTQSFGDLLKPYIFDIINSDANEPFEEFKASEVVKGAVITSNGKLTPNFEYIMEMRSKKEKNGKCRKTPGESEKTVLVLGAGFVATPLVEILTRDENVRVVVASDIQSSSESLAKKALKSNADSVVLDVLKNHNALESLINESILVVSLVPYALHPIIAEKCIKLKKNMITASYKTPQMNALHEQAQQAGITILNEVGLDPGIDHLFAMKCFEQVHSNGGKIVSFKSWCGGIPAPESADNSLLYKFSWNPRGVIMNTLSGARWLENGKIHEVPEGGAVMDATRDLDFLKGFNFEGYPNRDSIIYKDVYGLNSVQTISRGTIRYKGFCNVIKGFHIMNLLDMNPHPLLDPNGPEITWRKFMANILTQPEDILPTTVRNIIFEKIGHDEQRLKAFEELGFIGDELIDKKNSPFETLMFFLQKKLMYRPGERDLVVLHHEIDVEWPEQKKEKRNIDIVVYGDPDGHSAMAKTVGYTTGIAAKMILNGDIQEKGVIGPTSANIFNKMTELLQKEGIQAVEKSQKF